MKLATTNKTSAFAAVPAPKKARPHSWLKIPTCFAIAACIMVAGVDASAVAKAETKSHKAHVTKGKKKPKAETAAPASPANLQARHQVCLSFIQRHGLSCDPWSTPLCGSDLGVMRPLECVAP